MGLLDKAKGVVSGILGGGGGEGVLGAINPVSALTSIAGGIADWQSAKMQNKAQRSRAREAMNFENMQRVFTQDYQTSERKAAEEFGKDEREAQFEMAKHLQQHNMDYTERMSNTAYQRKMADLKKAGLNPMLAYAGPAATTPGAVGGSVGQAKSTPGKGAPGRGHQAQMVGEYKGFTPATALVVKTLAEADLLKSSAKVNKATEERTYEERDMIGARKSLHQNIARVYMKYPRLSGLIGAFGQIGNPIANSALGLYGISRLGRMYRGPKFGQKLGDLRSRKEWRKK